MTSTKKHAIVLPLMIVVILITCTRGKVNTPEEYLYKTEISNTEYTADSLEVLFRLQQFLKAHEESFYSTEYFDSTQLMVDTIVYSAKLDRLAVLVISKNPTYRQRYPDKDHEWYYDATCYLGLKQNKAIALAWIGPNFSNSPNVKKMSGMIRDACLTGFARRDTLNGGLYRYNLNDIRFWDGPIWKKYFDTLKL